MRTVEVTLRQLDKLNSLLDGALKAGLNEIRSVSLGVAQPDAYKDKARKAAIDNAIHQAQELANGFNRKLGPYIACVIMFPTISPAQWCG
ncbi:oxidative stress defense protein [Escherichia coli]|nr:oxidative stress defense protein [Escherichia coli]